MKRKLKPQYYRWTRIDEAIRSGRRPSAARLADMLEVSVKTVRRDIDYLRDMLGAPIEYDPARKGLYYTDDSFKLGALKVSGDEYLALLLASRVFSQYKNTPWFGSLAALFGRMREFLSDEVEVDPDLLETSVLYFGGPVTNVPDANWTSVMDALRARRVLRFDYRRSGSIEPASYSLETYRVAGYRGDWYCVGRCPERKAIRIFSMARMSSFSEGDPYEIPASFRLEDHLRGDFGMFHEDHEYGVEIEFDGLLSPFIRERVWGEAQTIRETAGGGIVLSFTASSLVELTGWVLSHGRHARALSPPELVERIKEEIEEMVAAE